MEPVVPSLAYSLIADGQGAPVIYLFPHRAGSMWSIRLAASSASCFFIYGERKWVGGGGCVCGWVVVPLPL